jgi:hypothetical protein
VLIAWRLASPPFDRVSLPGSDKLQVSLHAGGLLAFAFALALAATAWKGHQAQATPAG